MEQILKILISVFIWILGFILGRLSFRKVKIRFSDFNIVYNYDCPESKICENAFLAFRLHIVNNKHLPVSLTEIKVNFNKTNQHKFFIQYLNKVEISKEKFREDYKFLDRITEINLAGKESKTVNVAFKIESIGLLNETESITFSYKIGSGRIREINEKDVNFLLLFTRGMWKFNEKYISKDDQVVVSGGTSKHHEILLRERGLLYITDEE